MSDNNNNFNPEESLLNKALTFIFEVIGLVAEVFFTIRIFYPFLISWVGLSGETVSASNFIIFLVLGVVSYFLSTVMVLIIFSFSTWLLAFFAAFSDWYKESGKYNEDEEDDEDYDEVKTYYTFTPDFWVKDEEDEENDEDEE